MAQQACDLFLLFVFQGSAPVRDWRQRRVGQGGEAGADSSCSASTANTWPVLRRHFLRSLAERFSVQPEAMQGPWMADGEAGEAPLAASSETDTTPRAETLKKLIDEHPKISSEIAVWLSENTPGDPLTGHVAFTRLTRELRRQMKSGNLLSMLTAGASSCRCNRAASGSRALSNLIAVQAPG